MTPVITLLNGIRIANMSSPHPFNFTTGEELPACSNEVAEKYKLETVEELVPGIKGTTDIRLEWKLTPEVSELLRALNAREDIDIVLVPFPVMQALKEANWAIGKCRAIRVENRISKAIHSDRFCI